MRLAALLSLALLSCAYDRAEPYTFDVDSTLSWDRQAMIAKAMGRWCSITMPGSCPSLDGGHWRIANAFPPDICGARISGCTQMRDRIVWIIPDLSPGGEYAVALHELGHVLGLQHTCISRRTDVPISDAHPGAPVCSDVSAGVMDPDNDATDFTDADRAECRRVGSCQ